VGKSLIPTLPWIFLPSSIGNVNICYPAWWSLGYFGRGREKKDYENSSNKQASDPNASNSKQSKQHQNFLIQYLRLFLKAWTAATTQVSHIEFICTNNLSYITVALLRQLRKLKNVRFAGGYFSDSRTMATSNILWKLKSLFNATSTMPYTCGHIS